MISKNTILGLDISTSCIGWCVLDASGVLLDVGYLKLQKMSENERLDVFEAFLVEVKSSYTFSYVFVEAPLARSNNQFVVNILQRWNGACCAYIYKILGGIPELIPELTARKLNGIKVPKGVKGKDKKKYVLEHMLDAGYFPKDKIELKRTGNYKDYCFDMADSIVIGVAGYNGLQQ